MLTKYILGGSALALVLVVGIWQVQVARLEAAHFRAISAEQQKTRDVQSAFDAYKLQVEQANTDQANIRADENRRALETQRAMELEINRLRGTVIAAQRARDQRTAELLNALKTAPMVDTEPLGPAARAYLDRVRDEQAGAGTANNPTAGGGAN